MDFSRCVYCQSDLLAGASVCRYCSRAQPRGAAEGGVAVEAILDQKYNVTAIIALVASALWIFWVGSVIGIILGHQARADIDANPDQGGRGAATAAIWLGWIGLAVVAVIAWIGAGSSVTNFIEYPGSSPSSVLDDASEVIGDSSSFSDEDVELDTGSEGSSSSSDEDYLRELYLDYDDATDCVANHPTATLDECEEAFDTLGGVIEA